jgi:hypothetical protein
MDRTVAVTGGSDNLGRAVVATLIDEGWTVVTFDRIPSPDSRARFISTDLTDYGQLVEALLPYRRGSQRRRRRRPSGRHSGCDLRPQRRHVRQQPCVDLPRLPGRQAVQDFQLGASALMARPRISLISAAITTCSAYPVWLVAVGRLLRPPAVRPLGLSLTRQRRDLPATEPSPDPDASNGQVERDPAQRKGSTLAQSNQSRRRHHTHGHEARPRLDRPGRWGSHRLRSRRHLARDAEDGAVDPRCAASRVRVAQGCAHAGDRRLPTRCAQLPRRWCFHQATFVTGVWAFQLVRSLSASAEVVAPSGARYTTSVWSGSPRRWRAS